MFNRPTCRSYSTLLPPPPPSDFPLSPNSPIIPLFPSGPPHRHRPQCSGARHPHPAGTLFPHLLVSEWQQQLHSRALMKGEQCCVPFHGHLLDAFFSRVMRGSRPPSSALARERPSGSDPSPYLLLPPHPTHRDGLNAVFSGVLRGSGQQRTGALVSGSCFLFSLPTTYSLAFLVDWSMLAGVPFLGQLDPVSKPGRIRDGDPVQSY